MPGGWLKADKSKAQIARDKKRAQAQRQKGKPQKRQTASYVDAEDDDDSFLVQDGEEESFGEDQEAEWSEQDEDEEDEDLDEDLHDDSSEASMAATKRPAKKPAARSRPRSQPEEVMLFSSDEEEEDGPFNYFSKMKKPAKQKSKPVGKAVKKPPTVWSDNDEILTSPEANPPVPPPSKKRPFPDTAAVKSGLTSTVTLSSADSDDEDTELLAPNLVNSTTAAPPPPATTSSFFDKKKARPDHIDDVDEEMQLAMALSASMEHQSKARPKKKSRVFHESDSADDDDDDDDGEPNVSRGKTITTESAATDIVDSDEERAVNIAIEDSLASAGKPRPKKKKKKNRFRRFASSSSVLEDVDGLEISKDSQDMLEEEEAPEDEDDNYGDEEKLDKDALEARSILNLAKRLSGDILQTLTSWGGSGGMIVQDGAVAFSGDAADSDQKVSSRWISDEVMREVCENVQLAPYQLIGVNWLALLHSLTVPVNGKATSVNGVLADEMGLGKTCQTIAFLSLLKYRKDLVPEGVPSKKHARRRNEADSDSDDDSVASTEEDSEDLPHLIVVPASVLSNWENEFRKFAPKLNVVKFHGSLEDREYMKDYLRNFLPGKRKRRAFDESLDVILVPVTYFQKEKSEDRSFLRKFRYNYMICDEAHLLKNHEGQRYKTLNKFRTRHRLLLSGTPVMNNPQELMSLLCFLMPLFSRKSQGFEGNEDGSDGGSRMLQHFVSLDRKGSDDAAAYRKLKELFAPFVLRRRKSDVLAQIMPPKTRKVEFVELDPVGRTIYNGVLEKHVQNKDTKKAREHLFTQLRKAAHHPLLLRTRYIKEAEKSHLVDCFFRFGAFRGEGCTRLRVEEEVAKFNDFDIHLTALELLQQNPMREDELRRYILQEEDLFSSAKCKRLRTLLPELVRNGHRVLVFSVWTNCLDLLSCLLEQLDMKYLRMEGSTPVDERQSLIDEFNRDASIPIFLLSTKACGLGINLTAADVCIMHDIDFNPFNDLQAEDRCHRIGQKKPVQVIKLVCKETVDEDIFSMQERKAKMSAAIMESSTFEAKKEREKVLQNAVDRYLTSPSVRKSGAGSSSDPIEVDDL